MTFLNIFLQIPRTHPATRTGWTAGKPDHLPQERGSQVGRASILLQRPDKRPVHNGRLARWRYR